MCYTTDTKTRCIKRELGMRRRVYPRRVESGRMTQKKADREITMMEDILADHEAKKREREPTLF